MESSLDKEMCHLAFDIIKEYLNFCGWMNVVDSWAAFFHRAI